jgi:proteasome assembly chaperone (PAC2) family protein
MMGDDDNTVRISLAVMSKLSDIQLENPELRDKVNSIKALVMKMKDKTEIPTSEIG